LRSGAPHLAGIEGPNLLQEALRAGLVVDCVFVAQGAERLLDSFKLPPQAEIVLLPSELLDSALTTESHSPSPPVEPPEWTWDNLLGDPQNSAPLVLVLAGIQDPGNLGTILRSAEAFGAAGILTLPAPSAPGTPRPSVPLPAAFSASR